MGLEAEAELQLNLLRFGLAHGRSTRVQQRLLLPAQLTRRKALVPEDGFIVFLLKVLPYVVTSAGARLQVSPPIRCAQPQFSRSDPCMKDSGVGG